MHADEDDCCLRVGGVGLGHLHALRGEAGLRCIAQGLGAAR